MAEVEYSHEDFELVRTDSRFGGFEEVKLKDGNTDTRFFRKSITPGNVAKQLNDVAQLESCILGRGFFATAYPLYEYEGKKWALISLPDEYYNSTGLAA